MTGQALKQYFELFDVAGADVFLPHNFTMQDSHVASIASLYAYQPPIPHILTTTNNEIAECKRCTNIARYMKNRVCGTGEVGSSIFIIGNPPTADETGRGLPFVGTAFMKIYKNSTEKKPENRFDKMLHAIGLSRGDCFITNITKCRPENQDLPQMSQCLHFLKKQIDAVKPSVLLVFGCLAANILFEKSEDIGFYRQNQTLTFQDVPVFVTYNPAEFNKDEGLAALTWEDLKMFRGSYGNS